MLNEKNGAWSWRGDVPDHPRLKELVAVRLERATPEVRWMLEVLCLSEPLTLEQLCDAVGPEAVVAGEDAGLILVERSGASAEVRFTHVLYAQLVRASLGKVRTLRACACSTPCSRNSRCGCCRPTEARRQSGSRPGTGIPMTPRSSPSVAPGPPGLSIGGAIRPSWPGGGRGITALDYLVDALLWQGKSDAAKAAAEAVIGDLSAEEYEYFTSRWSRMLWWMTGERPDEPTGSDVTTGDLSPSARLGSIARQAAMEATAGRGPSCISAALEVLDDADADDEARCWAAGAAMIGLGGQGRLDDALRLSDNAFGCARRLTDFNYRLLLSTVFIWLCRLSGNLDQAQRTVDDLRRELDSRPDPNAGLVALSEAEVVLASGRVREAIPLLHDATLRLDEIDFGGLSATAHLRLAESLARAGDVTGAKAELAKGVAGEPRTLEMFRPEQLLIKAWARVTTGDVKTARALLSDAQTMAEVQGEQLVEVQVHHAGVRWGDRGAARKLLRISPAVEGPFALTAALQARGFLDRNVADLIEASDRFAERGMAGEAADAMAQAAKVASRFDRMDAHRLANRAAAIVAAAGGFTSPALRAVVMETPLTRRQHEIATLAATGMSNRTIAEHMGIGVRTVESHLGAAYRRLGVTNRAELSELLSR